MRRALLLFGLLTGAFVFWLFAVWPPPSWYRTHWPRETAFMAMHPDTSPAAHSHRLYRPVPLDSIAPVMQDAVITGEDNKFRTHGGIDYLAMAQALGYGRPDFSWEDPGDRAALRAVLPRAWSQRAKLRGASTISQQLAKNLYLSASRNPLRKVKEAVITWRLESALGKRRIMELYLNIVELGEGVWGVEPASHLYFKRSAKNLSREEAAALAGTLPFPRSSNPGHRPGRMRWRQDLILRRMRGEEIEIPRTEEADSSDAGAAPAGADATADSVETSLPPADSLASDSITATTPSDSAR